MLRQFRVVDGKLTECNKEKGEVMIFVSPDKLEIRNLIDAFKIDEHNLNSALDSDEISRLEIEDDHTMIILKRPKNYSTEDNLLFRVTSIGIFLFKDRLIIVMPEDIQILEQRHSMRLQTLNDILIKLVYGTISHFLGHLKVINMMSDSIEQKIGTSMENKYLIHMYTLRKSLVYYMTGINSNMAVIDKLKMFSAKLGFSEDNMELLNDIIIENDQCKKLAETYSNILTVMITSRDAIVNNKLSNIMKRLTIITTIFMPLTLLSGIGGMSEWSAITGGTQNWYITYPLFFLGLGLIAVVTYFIFKWKGWT
ncbi:MAG: hypothetical protein A2086_03990 [Spirochaetes bacterium GWD1_27_9]|nr:MAG: hypothetical protein A2Z98_03140 [Spirochaetes bacterium GWB1_27_13]OHD24511.1 MAG: hypothetical protein A2Y34_03515 [Spirochaetes bacterium GWC1_27_15]OHD45135.1 MAG: hypothetical protein A2086_03990 [Spirochaetes bacterium GWD1_27_9]